MQFHSLAKSLALAATLLAALAAPVAAQVKEHTFKVGIGLSDDHPQAQAVRHFAERLQAKSGGKMNAKLFASGALGNDVSMTSALRGGTLEMTIPDSSTLMSLIKPFGVLNLPLTFNNEAEADAVLDGPFGQKLLAMLPDKGLIGLGFWENGFRQITNNRRAINTPEDLKGIKLRVPNGEWRIKMFQAYGASPSPMPLSEVFVALQTGVMDGQENPYAQIYPSRFYEVQKYLSISNHVYTPAFVTAGRSWDKFDPEVQQALTETAVEMQDVVYGIAADLEKDLLQKLTEAGMAVNEVDTAAFVAASQPIYDQFAQSVEGAGALIEKAQGLSGE